ncbi:MAG: threonine--tRNA ligase [Patescibacteria group bacterium]
MEQGQLDNIRHSFAHLLAAAVKELFPQAQLGIGPVIEDGFYYDFALLAEADLSKIEEKMRQIARKNLAFKKELWPALKATQYYKKEKQPFKLELIKELSQGKKPASTKATTDKVGMVWTGKLFLDLCRGGHVKNTKELPLDAFKLTRVAGAYWKGDEKNPMLTRIYGAAFSTKKELASHLTMLEEAERRDHKKLGPELGLFTFSDLVGSGLPLFTPKGTIIRRTLTDFVERLNRENGFEEVWIPHLAKPDLYKISGHLEKFQEDLFRVKGKGGEFVLKPMNCPHHIQIFQSQLHSYRELPIRYFQTTTVYRDEQSGELAGLTRVRSITQDDGHVFCTEEQIPQEFALNLKIQKELVAAVGLKEYWIRLSLRHPKNKKAYLGSDTVWSTAQRQMEDLLKKEKVPYRIAEGEAAFYGPKMDFMAKDSLGREWQFSTIQLDFNLPKRFGLEYTAQDGSRKTPVMIHRAFMGSVERFMAMLIEHYAGAFPFWLAPEQLWIVPVSDKFLPYAEKIAQELKGFRINVRRENETLGKKIREGEMQKIPYLLVVGEKEQTSNTISVRQRGKGDLGSMKPAEFLKKLSQEALPPQ